jgi:hypothetical protein
MLRSNIPYGLSNGFSPQPMMEIAQALSVGVESQGEIAIVQLHQTMSVQDFIDRMNCNLPEGLRIEEAALVYGMRNERKAPSLSSLATYAIYELVLPAIPAAKLEEQATLLGTALQQGRNELPLQGPGSFRHRAEALWGPEYLACGVHACRVALGTNFGEGFPGFLQAFEICTHKE